MYSTRLVSRFPAGVALVKLLLFALTQIPILHASPILRTRSEEPPQDFAKSTHDPDFWLFLGIAAALVFAGGAFAGLTIALMGQDEVYLQVIKTSGEGAEKRHAETVLNLLQRGKHWVLVTLLLSNVITNETLPVILDRSLGGGFSAVIGSTVLIVIFGEVVPQSICVRYGLSIGAWAAPCVLFMMYIMSPVAWPIAKLLDKLLGEDHGTIYKKAGLKTLVTLHKSLGTAGEQLNSDEVTIISAVLDLKDKSVGSIMIPMQDVFTMSADTILDEEMMDLILSQGYSRIPIHSPDNSQNFVGMLLVKMLITYDPEDCKQVRDFSLATLPETRAETSCLDIVNFFQEGKSHMVLVSNFPGEDHGALGVVTLEDVIEELIGEEIIDESDVFIDVHKAIRRMAPAPKSRVPKNRIIEIPPSAHDLGDELTAAQTKTSEPDDSGHNRTSIATTGFGSPPPPTFYLRRSHTYDSHERLNNDAIVKRGATPEIREQLKHLGPSNLASKPRQTRYNAVKIKRGISPSTRSNHVSNETGSERLSSTPPRRASESTHLLANGTQKDATIPKRSSYGDLVDLSDNNSTPTARHEVETRTRENNSQNDLLQIPRPKPRHPTVDNNDRPSSPKNDAIHTSGTTTPATPPFFPQGPTRSGSITEQIIDSHGIRKVILQTSSHSPSDEDDKTDEHKTSSSKSVTSPAQSEPTSKNTDNYGSVHPSDHTSVSQPGPISGGKKKRRRKKKGGESKSANSKNEETQPLLHS